jgi:hypothetical protein
MTIVLILPAAIDRGTTTEKALADPWPASSGSGGGESPKLCRVKHNAVEFQEGLSCGDWAVPLGDPLFAAL